MSQITNSLKSIDELIQHHRDQGTPETHALLNAVRNSYRNDADLDILSSIPPGNLTERLVQAGLSVPDPGEPLSIESFLSSLRAVLNGELNEMQRRGLNPSSLTLGPQYTFVWEYEPPAGRATPGPGPEPSTRQFRVEEMTFSLPEELRQEFQNQVDRLKSQEEAATAKLKELMDKEEQLELEKARLERENADIRTGLLSQKETLETQFEQERKLAREEIDRFKQDLEKALEENRVLIKNRSQELHDYESGRKTMEDNFNRHEVIFQAKFDEMTQLMENLLAQEKDLMVRRDKELKALLARDKQVQKLAAQQLKRTQLLEQQIRAAQAERKKLKKSLEDQLEDKKHELDRDYTRKTEYLARRLEEWEEEEERVAKETEKLRVREQSLALEIKSQTDEQFKKRQAELDKREKKLNKREKLLVKQERENEREKEILLDTLAAIKGGKYNPAQFDALTKDQRKVSRRKQNVVKSIEEDQKKAQEDIAQKLQEIDKEREKALAALNETHEELLREQQRLRKKEKDLVRRETTELKRLKEEYEELRNSFEVEQIEKEMTFDEKEDRLNEDQSNLAEKLKNQAKMEEETARRLQESETEIAGHLHEVQALKENALEYQEKVNRFLDDFQMTYERILDSQQTEYDRFKGRIAAMENDASRVVETLKEKEKSVEKQTAASEMAVKERLVKREEMVEAMEKELRQKVQEYRSYMEELADVKKSMVEEDEVRRKELMDSVLQYEDKLTHLGKAFEDLSEAFHREREKGKIEIIAEEDERKPLEYDEALARAEWPRLVRHMLGLSPEDVPEPHLMDNIFKLSEKWIQWTRVPAGKFWMGHKVSKDAAPYQETAIQKPVLMSKFPVTNIEFFRFIQETGYKTEAETTVTAITYHSGTKPVYGPEGTRTIATYGNPTLAPDKSAFWLKPDGRPDSLYPKFHHPVTQVSWNDIQAFCRWKTEQAGKPVRLPTEKEWEFVASDFGAIPPDQFLWTPEEIVRFCNIEETGIGDTTPVDHFPDLDRMGGTRDLYGNVYEWVMDSLPKPRVQGLEYKIVRGGSFITNYKHIAPWRRLSFSRSYCTSFLGFRVVCEDT
ncbi:MAG: hypothetical protein COV67_04730 [Nitrospinae bacterium CG11_big_fil_rev_8_21_14_0_20_56_8]|nr:MAG: hypothetical protein COV67_04730 [Nitrospinae bacterium CG11_big_fil_rev_8_21_14_0_20_56_8]